MIYTIGKNIIDPPDAEETICRYRFLRMLMDLSLMKSEVTLVTHTDFTTGSELVITQYQIIVEPP